MATVSQHNGFNVLYTMEDADVGDPVNCYAAILDAIESGEDDRPMGIVYEYRLVAVHEPGPRVRKEIK